MTRRIVRNTRVSVLDSRDPAAGWEFVLHGRFPDQTSLLASSLARNFIDSSRASQQAELEKTDARLQQLMRELRNSLETLWTTHQILRLHHELEQLESSTDILQHDHYHRSPVQSDGGNLWQHQSPVERMWQPLLELEKFVNRLNLTPEERKRYAHSLVGLRASLSRSTRIIPEQSQQSDMTAYSVIGSDQPNGRDRQRPAEYRATIERLEASLPSPLDPGLTVALVEQRIGETQNRLSELELKSRELRKSTARLLSGEAVVYKLHVSEAVYEISATLFAAGMLATIVLSLIAAWSASRTFEYLGTLASFHSVAEAKECLQDPVLGVVGVGIAYRSAGDQLVRRRREPA